ncbi:MAG: NADH:ubiquinone oxidoreductase subunit NDUFA12 [Marinibacterium sp.]
MSLMTTITSALTWWNGQTLNTKWWTARNGIRVGNDDQGNVYYRTKDDSRRWVIYNGEAEASRIAPDWHAWLHRMTDMPPSQTPLPHKPWEKPHHENLTGTPEAYVPPGSLRRPDPVERTDYEAWSPGE